MSVATVTTTDGTLLPAVRGVLSEAEHALLCVAFVQERGIRLIQDELSGLSRAGAGVRMLVTTTFNTTTESALVLARGLGVDVRVLNPGSGSTFHPKLYLGRHGNRAHAVIGSANLTGGLATNLEAAVSLAGERSNEPLALAWDWAERLWDDPRARPWTPTPGAADLGRELIEPELLAAMISERVRNPVFMTLGSRPVPNRITDLTAAAVYVETQRSRAEGRGSREIPAWMFNLAWDYVRTHGRMTNSLLLDELRVHRSSAVCAILARIPGVRVRPGRAIELEWVGQ